MTSILTLRQRSSGACSARGETGRDFVARLVFAAEASSCYSYIPTLMLPPESLAVALLLLRRGARRHLILALVLPTKSRTPTTMLLMLRWRMRRYLITPLMLAAKTSTAETPA
jgi:hypothetical protein